MLYEDNVVRFNDKQLLVLKALGSLILKREGETNNNKQTTINAYSVHKECGVAYNTCKKYLKQLKEL